MTIPTVFQTRRTESGALAGDLGFLIWESAEVYHAQAGAFLSSHQLAEFRRNPLLFHKKEIGLVRDEDRPAYLIGRAAHVLILEGRERYERQYAVGGPINPKTGAPFGISAPISMCATGTGRVNLSALAMRLSSNCRNSAGSPLTFGK